MLPFLRRQSQRDPGERRGGGRLLSGAVSGDSQYPVCGYPELCVAGDGDSGQFSCHLSDGLRTNLSDSGSGLQFPKGARNTGKKATGRAGPRDGGVPAPARRNTGGFLSHRADGGTVGSAGHGSAGGKRQGLLAVSLHYLPVDDGWGIPDRVFDYRSAIGAGSGHPFRNSADCRQEQLSRCDHPADSVAGAVCVLRCADRNIF